MDKNKIKSFAIWARRNLIAAVSEKANRIGIWENKIEEAIPVQGGFKLESKDEIFPLSKSHRDALVDQVREKGFEQVMEEVAYTWFNRFMGLRYMEVNDYLPTGVRILSSSVEGKVEPDVLTKVSEIIDELGLNANEIYDLLDTGNTLDREKAYRIILVKQCNELGKIIPQMFEKISDYTELLLPDNLLEEGSVIRKMVEDIEESDWLEEVEIIGWMYQYYISEKKDEVFAALKKNVKITKENIPAATQLFTPKWIVKYMVENSLGRLWLEGHPNEELQKEWKYYLEEAEQDPEVEEELKKIREEHAQLKPEDIKVLDPCMGSGHILVYAFDVLYEIYKTAGYSEREIPRLILQNNLYGLDIDDRAAQLASFALIMKARHYNRRLFREIERENLELNLCSIQESIGISNEALTYFVSENEELINDINILVNTFIEGKEYGSILEVKKVNYEALYQRIKEIEQEENLMFYDYKNIILDKLYKIIKQSEILNKKFDVCITNPPYMGKMGMDEKLSGYLSKYYEDVKSDLFAAFMKRNFNFTKKFGFNALVTMQSWMFLSSYEELRNYIITKKSIISLINMDNMVMGIAFGTSATIFRNIELKGFNATYDFIKLCDIENDKPKKFPLKSNRYSITSNFKFQNLPGKIIAYWISDKYSKIFKESNSLNIYAEPKFGMSTADNNRFVRKWTELDNSKILKPTNKFNSNMLNEYKWFPYNNGGAYRKWYGNNEDVVNWENNGAELKAFKRSVIRNVQFYFEEGITWTSITSRGLSIRDFKGGYIFSSGGFCIFVKKDKKYALNAFMNSKVCESFLEILSPTVNFNVGDIAKLPIKKEIFDNENINKISIQNIDISKEDWDNFETSWDFKTHPLLKYLNNKDNYKLEDVFNKWELKSKLAFEQLKSNEQELNRILIDIYELQNDLTNEIDDKDITIRKADREREIKSFVSYAIGCMLGRYSIDAEGLIYAGGDFNDKWNLEGKKVIKIEKDDDGNVISDSWVDSRFIPDKNNIIPITEDEYFEDDIVSRFIEFVRVVYGNDTLEENLDFIADSIGRKSSETARQVIRRYFIKDFYKDHLKVYQKRPIYWMFESGKNDGFKCLIYMHRYNEQTVAKVRTDYLHILQRKYEAEINRLQLVVDSEEYTAKDRTAAKKKIDRISKQLEECKEYDQVVAYLANEKISIDLDDGVKVNYAKFQDVKVINSKGKEVKMNLLAKI